MVFENSSRGRPILSGQPRRTCFVQRFGGIRWQLFALVKGRLRLLQSAFRLGRGFLPPLAVTATQTFTTAPSSRSVLAILTKARLLDIARGLERSISGAASKDAIAAEIAGSGLLRFGELLQRLGRDELRAACRAHGLPDASRSRPELMAHLVQAHGSADSVPPAPMFSAHAPRRDVPVKNDIVRCRLRQWLVEEVVPSSTPGQATLVRLDYEILGRPLDVLWERELGASVSQPESHLRGTFRRLVRPTAFVTYLHALKWNAVTATDPKLFQAAFRAGIAPPPGPPAPAV
jgi:hypothetical protein